MTQDVVGVVLCLDFPESIVAPSVTRADPVRVIGRGEVDVAALFGVRCEARVIVADPFRVRLVLRRIRPHPRDHGRELRIAVAERRRVRRDVMRRAVDRVDVHRRIHDRDLGPVLQVDRNGVVRQLAYEDRFPVVLQPRRDESVKGAVQSGVGHRAHPFRDDRSCLAQRGENLRRLPGRTGPADHHRAERVSVAVLRDEREGRRNLPREEGAELPRGVRDVAVVRPDHLPRVLEFEEDGTADDLADWLETELEVRDDAEVPATAAQCPEEIFVRLRRRGYEGTVRKDDIRRCEIVQG